MGTWRAFWFGQFSLWKAFWVFYILGWIAVSFVGLVVAMMLYGIGLEPFGRIAYSFAFCVYPIVAAVGVWRSANVYPYTRWWPNLAKGWVILMIILSLWRLLHSGPILAT